MHLLIGQIVYTSLARMGFRSLASSQVPRKIQQAFMQQVAAKYWDTYNPPQSGYRAIYLHQLTREHTLFGWLYNDSTDDISRSHVPYFICYYLAEPLRDFHLENIFTCLQKGPLELIERQNLSASLENIVIQTPWTFNNDFWNYEPARPGVEIPSVVRERSHLGLKQGELLDIFLSVEQETVIGYQEHPGKQQIPNSSSRHFVAEIEHAALLNDDPVIETVAVTPYREYTENLHRYEQALVKAMARNYIIDDKTHKSLKSLQHFLQLTDEDIKLTEFRIQEQTKTVQSSEKSLGMIRRKNVLSVKATKQITNNKATQPRPESVLPQILANLHLNTAVGQSADHNFVLAYRNSQLLLGVGIAASSLALLGSIYGLLRTNISEPKKPELIPSLSSSGFNNLTEVSNVSQLLFKHRESTIASLRSKMPNGKTNQ